MSFRSDFEQARDFLILHRADYTYASENFKWPHLHEFNWALDYFDPMAEGNTHNALYFISDDGGEERHTFLQLSQRSSQAANFLRKKGLKKGDSLLLMVGNEVALWEMTLACIKAGVVIIPSSPLLSNEELEDRLLRGEVKAVVTSEADTSRFNITASGILKLCTDGNPSGWESYREIANEAATFVPEEKTLAADPLFIFFTSGALSKPKMVVHTHESFPVGNLSSMYWLGLRPGDLHMAVNQPGWSQHFWSQLFAPWNAEATVLVYKHNRFEAKAWLEMMSKYQVSSFCAPATVWRLLAHEDLNKYKMQLREMTSEGEPVDMQLIFQFEKAWGVSIREGYGQTETTILMGVTPGQKIKEGSIGYALPGYRIKLLNRDGQIGTDGEICVDLNDHCIGLMKGYRDQTAPAGAQRKQYFHTQDLGSSDVDGCYYILGRVDDVFKSSDYRISPSEIEAVLLEHPAVREVAVIPSPDDTRLNVPKALVFLAKGMEPTKDLALSLMTHTRMKLAPFKRVRRLEFCDLPKTVSGKVRRLELQVREKKKIQNQEKSPYEFWEDDFRASMPEKWAQEFP